MAAGSLPSPSFATATFGSRPTFAGATPYDSGNLTAGQVGSILGYAPARPSQSLSNTGSNSTGGIGVGSGNASYLTNFSFTTTGNTLIAVGTCTFTASGTEPVQMFIDLVRSSDGTVLNTGPSGYSPSGNGAVTAALSVPVSPGTGYQLRLRAYANDSTYTVNVIQPMLEAITA